MIRKLFVYVLIFTFINPVSSFASEELEALKKSIEEKFPITVENTHVNALRGYFYWRFQDYLVVTSGLQKLAALEMQKVSKAKQKWDENFQLASNNLGNFEQAAVHLTTARDQVARSERALGLIKDDFHNLVQSWNGRCSDTTLAYADRYFEPDGLIPVEKMALSPRAGNYVVQVVVPMNFDGTPGQLQGGQNGEMVQAAVVTTATAIGSCFAPPIGTVVGAAIGALISIVWAGIAEVNELNDQIELIDSIWETKVKAVNARSAVHKAAVRSECGGGMPNELTDSETSKTYNLAKIWLQQQVQSQKLYLDTKEISKKMTKDYEKLVELYGQHVASLEHTYFKNLKENYRKKLEEEFSNQIETDQKANAFIQNQVFPLLAYTQTVKEKMNKVFYHHALWDQMIQGDTSFYMENKFLFQNGGSCSFESRPGPFPVTAKLMCEEFVK